MNKETILSAVELVRALHRDRQGDEHTSFVPQDYRITNTAERVVKLIVGTAKLSNQWDGIRQNTSSIDD